HKLKNSCGFELTTSLNLNSFQLLEPHFKATFTERNIKAGFKGAGLVLYDPERVISCFDLRLRAPIPPLPQDTNWISKPPQNPDELQSQTNHIQSKIVQHQN